MTPALWSSCCCYGRLKGNVHKCWVIQWSWWTVHGRKTLTVVVSSSLFRVLLGCRRFFFFYHNHRGESAASWSWSVHCFLISASCKPDVGNQPWAVSLHSSSCLLFTTSLHHCWRRGCRVKCTLQRAQEPNYQRLCLVSLFFPNSDRQLSIVLAVRSSDCQRLWGFVVLKPTKINSAFASGSSPAAIAARDYSTVLLTMDDSIMLKEPFLS